MPLPFPTLPFFLLPCESVAQMPSLANFKRLLPIITVLSAAVAVGIALPWWYSPTGIQQRIAARAVEKDMFSHLPLGSSRGQVNDYLTRKAIQHVDDRDGGPSIIAFDHYRSHNNLINKRIIVVFRFSKDQKLAAYGFGDKAIAEIAGEH